MAELTVNNRLNVDEISMTPSCIVYGRAYDLKIKRFATLPFARIEI